MRQLLLRFLHWIVTTSPQLPKFALCLLFSGLMVSAPSFAAYVPLAGVSKIAAGTYHGCVLTSSGGVKCWGQNSFGGLGDGSTITRSTPVNVSGLTSGVADIAAGENHSCALIISNGGVKCWGANFYGQLGDGTTIQSSSPVDVGDLSDVTAIAAGRDHVCVLTNNGVKCWGQNSNGQLGDGTTTLNSLWVDVIGLTSGVTAIATGNYYSCALISGGVQCWGQNNNGQLGDGTTTDSSTPVSVSGLSGVTAIAAGRDHSCVLISGGVKCWGNNFYGQLGNGTTTDSLTPVSVSGLTSGVIAIAAGTYHTCALTSSGGDKCWGVNTSGQLGNGTTAASSSTPVDVIGLTSGVTAITAGHDYSCAVTSSGGAKCWGWNNSSQLGDATTTDSSLPVDVLIDDTPPTVTAVSVSLNPSGIPALNVGEVLRGDYTYDDVEGDAEYGTTFQWYQASDSSCTVGKMTIAGATLQTYTVVNADIGTYLCFGVTPKNSQAAGTEGLAATAGTINKLDQTISFAATGTVGTSATPATATSGLAVTLTSSTTSICTVSGATVNYLAVGTCSLTADQAGDANYNAAPQVSGNITVTNPVPPPTYPLTNSTPAPGQTIQFDTLVGQIQTKTLTLKNFGSEALIFNSINTPVVPFSYPKPMPFSFIPSGDPTGSPKNLDISCTPTEMGSKTMTLQIATNDPDYPTLNYPLECIGRLPMAVSSIPNNSPINFGNTLINSSLSQSITFTENGNTDLIINSATITGANADQFTAPTTFPITIVDNSNNSQAITVSCTPKTATPLTATLQVTTNDPSNSILNYPLQCGGLFSLTLNTSGQGTIGGCGSSCVQNYQQDAVVNLSAVPATGWQFSGWSGCTGQVQMTGNLSCTANFTQVVTNPVDTGSTPTGTTTPTNPTNPSGTTGTTTNPANPPTSPPGTTTGTTTPPSIPTSSTPTTNSGSGSGNVISVVATVPILNGVANGSMSNYNQTAINLTIPENSSVSGGVLSGTVTNSGLIANVTIAPNSTVTGGKLSSYIVNFGTLSDVTVSQYSEVRYGNYSGTTQNYGTLIEPIILPEGTMLNAGVVKDPILLTGAHLTGGSIIGMIITLGGTYSGVQTPQNVTVITHVQDIPPKIFSRFNEQTLQALPADIVSQINSTQFKEIPVEALSGLTSENMGAISPQVIQSLDKERIDALNIEAFKAMPTEGVAKLLTNFDVEQITPPEAEKLLPPQWKIDQYGNLTAPPNVRIALRTLNVENLPTGLKLPDLSDLSSSFALGGKGIYPVIKQINQVSGTAGFITTQQKTGVVHVSKSPQSSQKQQFSFTIDPYQIFLLDGNALRGLQINEQGQYLIVTEDGKQIPITPMTKDPEALLAVLGNNAEVDIQKTGEVFIKHPPISRARDSEIVNSVGIFDPFIEPAPEDICQEDANGEMQCDWSKADASMQPGLRAGRNSRAKAAAKVIYPDGSSQKLYPAVLSPDILVAEAKKMKGVEKAIFRMDGTFAVTYQGTKLLLIPDFDTQVQPIPVGQKVEPSLTLQNGTLTYRIPYGDNLITTQLSIIEAPSS